MQKNEAGFTAIDRQQLRQAGGMRECVACTGSGTSSAGAVCRGCAGTSAQKESRDSVQYARKSVEHYTPAPVVDAARATLGGIDMDPASCALANETVKAIAWYGPGSTHGEDGLTSPWLGRVFLNPPGGRVPKDWQGMGTSSSAVLWWSVLASKWASGEVEAAIFVGFNAEILRSAQSMGVLQPIDFPMCVPKRRIAFDTVAVDDGVGDTIRIPSRQPIHANVIVYLPPRGHELNTIPVSNFVEHFEAIGRCRI